MAGKNSLMVAIVRLLVVPALCHTVASGIERDEYVYVVYKGGTSNSNDKLHTHELVTSLSKRFAVHTYMHDFLGFAARLTNEEAKSISNRPEVVSVFLDTSYALHTTRSWDFLEQQITGVASNATLIVGDASTAYGKDTIIGILDTGIWPESDSFSDVGMLPIRWKGICMEGTNFASIACNRKLIGARFYDDLSPWLHSQGFRRRHCRSNDEDEDIEAQYANASPS